MTATANQVVGLFDTRLMAHDAISGLRRAGFADSQIGLFSPDGPATGLKADFTASRWEEGAGIGAATGAMTGVGLGLAVVTGLISPLGPVVAGGVLMALLASAGGGATLGTILGGLAGLGIPEDDVDYYSGELKAGRSMVTVDAGDRVEDAEKTLRRHGASLRSGNFAGSRD